MQGDGGGHPPSWPNAIVGRDKVARLLVGLAKTSARMQLSVRPAEVNGQPGATIHAPDGGLINVITLDIVDGVVQTVRSVINPRQAAATSVGWPTGGAAPPARAPLARALRRLG